MGRPKKTLPKGKDKAAKDGKAGLQKELAEVRREIQQLHQTGRPERVETVLRLAGLQVRLWDLEGLLAENIDVRLACARQSASWHEQHIRASKALSVDLLRDLFAKAEEMERHSSSLRDLK